jgi:hypothetical protein
MQEGRRREKKNLAIREEKKNKLYQETESLPLADDSHRILILLSSKIVSRA